ncbi:MAG: histidine phosphatase family protein, partial [Dermatophilaceae bacterium]
MAATEGGRRLIVWRHGETDHNAGGIWQGQLDTALSATGREQAQVAAAVLA